MSTDRETTRIVRSWLEEGVTALPDRVLDTVLDQLPATPQRRSWWPARRIAHMNSYARIAIAAAAVLVVAVLGYNLLPRTGGIGGQPTPVPTVTPTAAPTASPASSPSGPPELTQGDLTHGAYSFSNPTLTEVPFTVTVSSGWTFNTDNMLFRGLNWKDDGVALTTWKITHVYADGCKGGALVPAGTKELVVAALAAQLGHETSGPTEVTLGGLPATRFEFSFAPGFDMATCDGGPVLLWPDPGPNTNGGLPMFAGQTTTVYVMEGNGKAFAVVTIRNAAAPASHAAELQAILDSIEFQV
jgi:hypothetical protein